MNKYLKGISIAVLGFFATRIPVLAQSYSYSYSFNSSAYNSILNALDNSAAEAGGIFAAAMIVPLIIGCIFFVINIAVSIWIFKDAKKHNVENPVLWGILSFFLSWIGWLIYFLAIRNKATSKPVSTPVTPVSNL